MNVSQLNLFLIALLLAAPTLASVVADDTGDAREASRSLLEDAQTSEKDFKSLKAADRAAWGSQGGEGRKRALKATFGSAFGEAPPTQSDPTSSTLKVQPDGLDCLIKSSSSATADCTVNSAYVVPACCSSSLEKSSTTCQSWDTAQNIICANAATPYPSCCVYRNQPKSACDVYSTSTICGTAKPGVGCCGSSTCSLNDDGSGGTCPSGTSIGCCPA